jgi:chromosome partitioning related protein ParA
MRNTIYQALVGTKGGIGKTGTVVNLGALYAGFGLRVLMVDADPQGSASKYYDLKNAAPNGFLDLLECGTARPRQISTTVIDGLDVIRADFSPSDVVWFESHMRRDIHLKYALRNDFVEQKYDVVLIDSQGARSAVQEAAALAAADVLTPITPHVINLEEFQAGIFAICARTSPFIPARRSARRLWGGGFPLVLTG